MNNLLEHLETLTESRHAKGKQHSQTVHIAIVLLGMLCEHVHIKARFATLGLSSLKENILKM